MRAPENADSVPLDDTDAEPPAATGAAASPKPDEAPISLTPVERAFPSVRQTIALRREGARWWIAFVIVMLLAFIVVASFASLWWRGSTSVDDIVKVISPIIGPVIGIVGAVTGFYFSESKKPDD
jgi:hypothetical protein